MNKKVKRDFLIFGLGVLAALTIPLACTRVVEEDPPPQAEPAGGVKVGVHDDNKVKVASINWGLKVRNFSELFLLSGYGATDAEGTVQFPGDAAAQQAKFPSLLTIRHGPLSQSGHWGIVTLESGPECLPVTDTDAFDDLPFR